MRFESERPSTSARFCNRCASCQGRVALMRVGLRRIRSAAGAAEPEPPRGWKNEVINSSLVGWSRVGVLTHRRPTQTYATPLRCGGRVPQICCRRAETAWLPSQTAWQHWTHTLGAGFGA
jgi:hypothetical protein